MYLCHLFSTFAHVECQVSSVPHRCVSFPGSGDDQQQCRVPDSCFWYCASCSSPSHTCKLQSLFRSWLLGSYTVTPLHFNLFQFQQSSYIHQNHHSLGCPDQYVCLGAPSNLSTTSLGGVETGNHLPKKTYKDQTVMIQNWIFKSLGLHQI